MSHKYKAVFLTGHVGGSGTDADVTLALKGTSGEASEIFTGKKQFVGCPAGGPLPLPDYCDGVEDPFEKHTKSAFDINANQFIGEITEIAISVDDSRTEDNPAWYLEQVNVQTYVGGISNVWKFPVERWIGTGKDPHHREEQVNHIRVNHSGPIIG